MEIATVSAWEFSQATTYPYRTSGTAATVIFCGARPHGISRIEGSDTCLPAAEYARCGDFGELSRVVVNEDKHPIVVA